MYGVLRVKKHKNDSGLTGMTLHNKREIRTLNADPLLTKNNIEVIGTGNYRSDVNDYIEKSGGMIQKNGVKAVEHLFSASPEYFQTNSREELQIKIKDLYQAIKRSLDRFYGPDSKIVSCSLHLDEKTPHFHLFLVPGHKSKLKGGREVLRIGARKFLGEFEQLSKLQDVFGEEIKPLGLARGIKKSKAQHIAPRKYYALQNQKTDIVQRYKVSVPEVEKPGRLMMNPEQWAIDQTKKINQSIKPQVDVINGALNNVAQNSLHQDLHFLSGQMKLELEKKEEKLKQLKAELDHLKTSYQAQDTVVRKHKDEKVISDRTATTYENILIKIIKQQQLDPTELTIIDGLRTKINEIKR